MVSSPRSVSMLPGLVQVWSSLPNSHVDTIAITGGHVTATGYYGAGIGGGWVEETSTRRASHRVRELALELNMHQYRISIFLVVALPPAL
jgi:hypothetical protein